MKKEIIYLIRQYYRIQEHRIAFGNQIRALKEQNEPTNPLDTYFNELYAIEKSIKKYLANEIKDEPIWVKFLKKVKGIGPVLASGLINLIDIKKAQHPSSLWKFAGLDVVDGKARKKVKGEKLTYNPLMRTLCWKLAKSFLMSNSQYVKYYKQRKEYEKIHHPEFTPKHIDARARRYMVKRFLVDLFVRWRELEGLPVSKPYVVDKLGHHYEEPII